MLKKQLLWTASVLLLLGLILVYRIQSESKREPTPTQVREEAASTDQRAAVESLETESAEAVRQKISELALAGSTFDRLRFSALISRLVQIGPLDAAKFAESMDPSEMKTEALRRVTQLWATRDLASAQEWALHLSNEEDRQLAVSYVCYEVGRSDPKGALELADHHGLGARPIMEDLFSQWAIQDFVAAQIWLESRPSDEQRDRMFNRLALIKAKSAPEEAANMALKQIPAGSVQMDTIISVLDEWAKHDLSQASAWVDLLPPGPDRDQAAEELARIKSRPDPNRPPIAGETIK